MFLSIVIKPLDAVEINNLSLVFTMSVATTKFKFSIFLKWDLAVFWLISSKKTPLLVPIKTSLFCFENLRIEILFLNLLSKEMTSFFFDQSDKATAPYPLCQ